MKPRFEIDQAAGAAYLKISNMRVDSSKELLEGILVVDFDVHKAIVGIEIVSIEALQNLNKEQRSKVDSTMMNFSAKSIDEIIEYYRTVDMEHSILKSILPKQTRVPLHS